MSPAKKISVLIVDDDPDDRDSLRDAFIENDFQHDYVFLTNAEQLLGYLNEPQDVSNISLILLDLNMPGLDGRHALREIKSNEKFKHIPIVVLTTSSSPNDRQVSYSLGANCFITKPDSFRELIAITGGIGKFWLSN